MMTGLLGSGEETGLCSVAPLRGFKEGCSRMRVWVMMQRRDMGNQKKKWAGGNSLLGRT